MAAFTYQQQPPRFNLDSLFMSNNCIINPIYFPSMQDSSSNVRLIGEKIEPFMSEKTKQISTTETPTTSSIVVDFEGDDQVKTQPSMEKKKRKNGSCSDSDKDGKQRSKPKKQRKADKKKKDDDDHKQTDYVHVRARRGQANDSHSLAERVRREKISERLKMLQSLVPGCDKVNSKAHMLDEIINYVQSLQLQMLSMKLAHMNPVFYDFGVDLDVFFQKPTLATSSSSPLPLTTTHQDSMTHDTSAIPLHENSVSFSPLQQEVHQQKLNDLYQVLLQQQQQQQQQVPNNEELLCYMDYYHLHHRQQGATNLFYYE